MKAEYEIYHEKQAEGLTDKEIDDRIVELENHIELDDHYNIKNYLRKVLDVYRKASEARQIKWRID